MSMTVSFRGGETAGGVSNQPLETARQETTGGVGARRMQDSIFLIEEPRCDAVCFRSHENPYERAQRTSAAAIALGTVGVVGLAVGLLGLAYKHDAINKYLKDGRIKHFLLEYSKHITEPCYRVCRWLKNDICGAIINYIKTKIH